MVMFSGARTLCMDSDSPLMHGRTAMVLVVPGDAESVIVCVGGGYHMVARTFSIIM